MTRVKQLSMNHLVTQREGNIVSDMGNEKVMLNIENGKYYNLGTTGGEMWELIAAPITVSEVVTKIMTQYDVSKEQCEEEVLSFLEHMYEEKLVQVTTQK